VFIAGQHNTTTDAVTIYNPDLISGERRAGLAQLQAALHKATAANRAARQALLPGHDTGPRAGVDWSQVRPEWGLAGNAFFVIGPRALTENIPLGGRSFLHSYDHTVDPEGKALEVILTAPLVVTEWINTQYLFSTLDPVRFGSDTKITHNVVGKFGILQGNTGDLQVGLPLQSVMQEQGMPYHVPVRLMAVVAAPLERVKTIIRRHTVLQQFFDNTWVALTVIEPDTGALLRYKPGGTWEQFPASTPAPLSVSAVTTPTFA
jgi:uncharacterized protein YbcC (UPF0753/DUF2309 family)